LHRVPVVVKAVLRNRMLQAVAELAGVPTLPLRINVGPLKPVVTDGRMPEVIDLVSGIAERFNDCGLFAIAP